MVAHKRFSLEQASRGGRARAARCRTRNRAVKTDLLALTGKGMSMTRAADELGILAEHREPDSPGPAHRRDHSEFGLARRGATCQRSALLRVTARPDPRTGPGSLPMDPATVAPWWRYAAASGTTAACVHPPRRVRARRRHGSARDGRRGPATRCALLVAAHDGRRFS